jgi:hypothetical protein
VEVVNEVAVLVYAVPLDLAFQCRESGHGWPRWRLPVLALQNNFERIAAMSRGCSHGKTLAEPCIDCKLVLAREGLAWAQQGVERYSKLIAEMEGEIHAPPFHAETMVGMAESKFPLHYEDGPDYCTVRDAQGRDFALTMQPDLMKQMERALRKLEEIHEIAQDGNLPCWQALQNIVATSALPSHHSAPQGE